MARLIVFDDINSFIHLVLGFLVVALRRLGLGIVSIAIIVVYTAYQVLEKEKSLNKLGDFIEFLIGYILGESVF